MPGVQEAHLLNITVAPAFQRQGWAHLMLDALALYFAARRTVAVAGGARQQHARTPGVRGPWLPAGGPAQALLPVQRWRREDAVVMEICRYEPGTGRAPARHAAGDGCHRLGWPRHPPRASASANEDRPRHSPRHPPPPGTSCSASAAPHAPHHAPPGTRRKTTPTRLQPWPMPGRACCCATHSPVPATGRPDSHAAGTGLRLAGAAGEPDTSRTLAGDSGQLLDNMLRHALHGTRAASSPPCHSPSRAGRPGEPPAAGLQP